MTLTAIWGAVDAAAASNENGAVWRRMRRFMERRGLPWVALRAPEFAPRKGHHLHLVFHCPDKVIRDVICLVEDITGEQAAWFNEQGRRLGWMKGIVAKSVGPDWMLQRHLSEHGPNDALIGYVAKGSGKARAAGRHQRSQALIELEKSA